MFTVILNICRLTTKKIQSTHITSANIFPQIVFNPQLIQSDLQKLFFSRRSHHIPQYLKIALENIHHQQIENKLSVIYQLGQLANEHPQYHWLIIEALASFVKNQEITHPQMLVSSNSTLLMREEIQAALTVIISRNPHQYPQSEQLDLSYTNMRGADLRQANLVQANLYQVNLADANLTGANLSDSILSAANLAGANLTGANLSGAILSAANLAGANLTNANLQGANLYLANLEDVFFHQTILTGANLREAKLTTIEPM
ncbi:pentapeptide repeat-containing protein [Nostoc sp. TCL26-01]|uniref:pentapeptide repeat-containing protein n=1 Tax=Nostoc sp. TCL26-01 TaxID=2576904 RepID=UPI0015B86BE6|nr:pentapeptide repeat-containing protein [Nostoc sp. TCL26-01]QLE54609.1 pentapeptide repeat-containing protein [Nostoc sp. TCL26-01]